ncbi:MAG: carboxypeptidase regulatory-like domain-containing protein, partial [Myxococcaceae bacterium]|nr:carboxypeptidase regulatory-like domain-containing protein [Myxococcaceae bacterium]
MKRALFAVAVLVLGGALWWARGGRAVRPGVATSTPNHVTGPVSADAPVAPSGEVDAGVPELPPLPTLHGTVRDATGGVAQATVEVRRRRETEGDDCEDDARTTSVSGGAFDLGALCPGQYDVRATRGSTVAIAVARLARGAEHPPLELVLREGTRLSVRARDGKKAPLAGVAVRVQEDTTGWLATAETGSDGVAQLEGLSPVPHNVYGDKPGWLPASLYDRTLAPGDEQVDLTLLAGAFFSGRVVDPDGLGLDGVWVRLAVPRRELRASGAETGASDQKLGRSFDSLAGGTTTDGGELVIGPVRPGPYTLLASHDGYPQSDLAVKVPGPRVVVKLGRGASVDGLFLDADGAPVAEGEVQCERPEPKESKSAHVDELGRFELNGLGPGEW